MICKRAGCEREAHVDEFCGTICAKLYYGALEFDPDASKKRKSRKARYRRTARALAEGRLRWVTDSDVMDHRLPGSFGTGKRR